MFLALRDLVRGRGRFALVGLVVALVALLGTLLSGLATGLTNDGISGLRGLPLDYLAFQAGSDTTFSRSSLDEKQLDTYAKGVDGKTSAIGVSFFNAKVDGGETIDIALFGIPEGSFLAPRQDAQASLGGTPGIVLSEDFKEQGIKVGDTLTVVGPDIKLPVLGFTYAGSYGHVDLAFTSLETWQNLMYGDNARGRFSAIAVSSDAAPSAALDKAAGTKTVTKVESYQGSPGYAAESATMALIRFFLLAISALVVGAFFTVWTIQRTGQIGLLKALGASNRYILVDAIGQLLLVLVISTAIGTLVGVGLGSMVGGGVPFRMEASDILTSAGLLIILGVVGSLVAVRRITKVDPIVAMGAG